MTIAYLAGEVIHIHINARLRADLIPSCRHPSRYEDGNSGRECKRLLKSTTLKHRRKYREAHKTLDRLPTCHHRSSHSQNGSFAGNWNHTMATESPTHRDSLRTEKLSLLVLALCVVVLVGLLVFQPF